MTTASSLAPYRSPEARDHALREAASRCGADVLEYGRSLQGRSLLAARIPPLHTTSSPVPRVLCSATIHGIEYVAAHVALAFLDAADTPLLSGLREKAEVWVIPCINPDGYARTWEMQGDAALALTRTNANGVDLNRNFPLPTTRAAPRKIPWAGSNQPGSVNFRGFGPLSEPETHSLDELFASSQFHASANLHSFMGTMIPAHVDDRASFVRYKQLARSFANAQRDVRYRRLSSRHFDVFTGEQEDHQHHRHACWAMCIEVFSVAASLRQHLRAPTLFWRFNPRDPERWVNNDLPGLVAFFEAALTLPRPSTESTGVAIEQRPT